MKSIMKQAPPKFQTCAFRVNIHCDGCRKKVKKVLQKISGVQSTSIDAQLGKVIVTGYVDPKTVIKKLVKSGKHAELWGSQAQPRNSHTPYQNQNQLNNQFKNMQIDFFDSDRADKKQQQLQKGGFRDDRHHYSKGSNDMKMVLKDNKKSVTFDMDDDDESCLSDDFEDDGFELDIGRHPPRTPSAKGGGGGAHGHRGAKGKSKSKKGIFHIPLLGKGRGKKNDGKNSMVPVKNDAYRYGGKNGTGSHKNGNVRKTEEAISFEIGPTGGMNTRLASKGGGGGKDDWGKGGKKPDPGFEIDVMNHNKGRIGPDVVNHNKGWIGPGNGNSNSYYGGGGFAGQTGQMGNYPMRQAQMGNYQAAVQGLPAPFAANGGYHAAIGPQNPYSQQQQHHMAMNMMMMNQQRAAGNPEIFGGPPMMYGRPSPHYAMNYNHMPMPPVMTMPLPPRASDAYTHMFSDENTESCSIM